MSIKLKNILLEINVISPSVIGNVAIKNINGMYKLKAIKYLYKLLTSGDVTKKIHKDNNWQPIHDMFTKLKNSGVNYVIKDTKYIKNDSGNPISKIWDCELKYMNDNIRETTIYMRITAAGAGSIQDPLEQYDITVVLS